MSQLSFTLLPAAPSDIPTLAKITAKACQPDLLVRVIDPNLDHYQAKVEKFLEECWRGTELELHSRKAVSPDGQIMGYLTLDASCRA
jgi:hypothetical protein